MRLYDIDLKCLKVLQFEYHSKLQQIRDIQSLPGKGMNLNSNDSIEKVKLRAPTVL